MKSTPPSQHPARTRKLRIWLGAGVAALSFASFGHADAPPGRYVLTAETVTDTETGLVWQRVVDPDLRSWAAATTYCSDLGLAGQTDWRLPSLNEFQTLIDESRSAPAVDTTAFAGEPFGYPYWTSSQRGAVTHYCLLHDGTCSYNNPAYSEQVRCVRP